MPPLEVMVQSLEISERSFDSCVTVNPPKNLTVADEMIASPQRALPSKPKKQVQFSTSVRVRKISSHKMFPEGMKRDIWYSQDEAKQIRKTAIKTLNKMMRNMDLGKNDCSRGLELKAPHKNRVRLQRKQYIISTIMQVQQSFYSVEEDHNKQLDAERISSIYRYVSRNCVMEGLKTGESDALEAKLAQK
jgi:hypothetical protein